MKKLWVIIAGVAGIVIAAVGIWYVLTPHKNSSTNSSSNSSTNTMNGGSNASSSDATATNSVTIQNFAFSPASITVKTGTTVTWTNQDSTAHTVTETDGKSGPNSGDVNPGAAYTFTFSQAGTYQYHCAIHPDMTGTVTVTN